MPDLNVGDNTAALRRQVQDALAAAGAAQTDAASARAQASTAQAGTNTAMTEASAAKAQASSVVATMVRVQRVTLTTPALTVAASIAELTVTWTVPFADTNYSVVATPWVTVGLIGKWTAAPKAGSQTTTGCVVIISSLGVSLAAGQTLDVLAIRA